MARMPASKLKASDVAAEAKRSFIPYCAAHYPHFRPNSILVPQARGLRPESADSAASTGSHLRVAVIEGDPVDVAIEWYEHEKVESESGGRGKGKGISKRSYEIIPIPVVNAANEKHPGGDWELSLIASEENLCRRSNLVHCLSTPWSGYSQPHYPIPQYGGIYSPTVVVYRDGPDRGYEVWPNFKSVPVISVTPTRRPKLDETGDRFSFAAEADLTRDKMKNILRIAADNNHRRLVVGSWGLGSVFRNPVRHLAQLWAELLFRDDEFLNRFVEIVFVIEPSSNSTGGSLSDDGAANRNLKIFREELDPSNNFKNGHKYRYNG